MSEPNFILSSQGIKSNTQPEQIRASLSVPAVIIICFQLQDLYASVSAASSVGMIELKINASIDCASSVETGLQVISSP